MSSLIGKTTIIMDAKHRLSIPAKLRNTFPKNQRDLLYITRGIEKCLTGYSKSEWQKFQTVLNKLKIDETTKRKIKRQFIGRAAEVYFDMQGRILLPDDLINFAELQNCTEVVVLGTSTTIEIWNPQLFDESGAATEDDIQKTFKEVSLG